MKFISRIATVWERETAAYFNSAVAYIFLIVFVLLNGGLFMTQFFMAGRADMRSFFQLLPFLLSIFIPSLTMRLWAEERKSNTFELLLTFPLSSAELVLGKFLAAYSFYLLALAATFPIPAMLCFLGRPDFGMIAGGYLGAAFLGAFYIAVGIFISGLCMDQIVAFILSMMCCFSLYLAGTEFVAMAIDGWIPGCGTVLRLFVSTARHFDSFGKGVVDSRDVFYFMIGTANFLVLNGFWIEGRLRPRAKTIFTTAVATCAGIFLAANWLLADISLGRFDLTEGKIYTVSPVTKEIFRKLKTPVTVKFYVSPSEKMPTGMKTMEQDMIAKLDEFRNSARGNFQYKIFHMDTANVASDTKTESGGSLEAKLSEKGIDPFQVQSVEADEMGVRLIYSSLSISYKEKPEEIIPQVMPEQINELEYLLVSKIFRMTLPEDPKMAMVAPYEERSMDPQMQMLLEQLGGGAPPGMYREDNYEVLETALKSEGYDVARIRLNKKEPIPAGVKTLLIVEPNDLTERQQYEINRFLREGGSVFFAVQNYEFEYRSEGGKLNLNVIKKNPKINPLLEPWGLGINDDILMDSQNELINISGGVRIGIFEIPVPVKLPIQILIPPAGMNKNVSITSRLSSMFYLWGSALKINSEKLKNLMLDSKVLLSSSRESWTMPLAKDVLTPASFVLARGEKTESYPLAVLVQGQFPDTFEGKAMPAWEQTGETKEPPAVATAVTPAPGKLILVGAATMFQKQLVRGGGHLNFFLNAVDALTLGDELIAIRSKQPIDRSLRRISTPEKLIWKLFTTVLIPVLVVLIGAVRIVIRKRKKENYLKSLAEIS